MNYIDKIKYLIEREEKCDYDMNKYDTDTRFRQNKWQKNELEDIIKAYDFIPESYVKFIKEFDNLGITFCVFYGSKAQGLSLSEEIDEFKEYLKYDYFPFGKFADGSVFAFNKEQEVVFFVIDDYEFKHPRRIAKNFDEFVEDFLIGKRYKEFIGEDECYAYFKHLGWVN